MMAIKHICYFVVFYEKYLESYIAIMNKVCYCYGFFVCLLLLAIIWRSDLVIIITLDKYAINIAFLNHCSHKIDKYHFYYPYLSLIKQKKIFKFSSINKVNITIC